MSIDSLLMTFAEMMIAVAGFGSVVAVLSRPLPPLQRQRFLQILLTSLAGVLGALVPGWLSQSGLAGPAVWRASSGVLLAITLAVTAINVLAVRDLGARVIFIVNRPVTYLMRASGVVLVGLLVVNLVGPAPSFSFYYASLLCGLAHAFVIFADVVLQGDESTS